MQTLAILDVGVMGYERALQLQQKLVARRQAGGTGDVLVLVEHPPVITLGRNARAENVLTPGGVAVVECDRGGDVTYHGPGQLVGYPIFDLRGCARPDFLPARTGRLELGPVDFVRALEEVLIGVAADCGVEAARIAGLTGVWTRMMPEKKLAAIGIHVARGVTSHGFALNVEGPLDGFSAIVPCGIRDRGVTSLSEASGRRWTVAEAAARVRERFAEIFKRQLAEAPVSWDD
ncbi:MAG TPA: lipoyl(octanoyl) transferase LipB [Terriglobales bacterium]|nr:lipoyl(octanoyl) transferase LipB [Terriglobales bacterium]